MRQEARRSPIDCAHPHVPDDDERGHGHHHGHGHSQAIDPGPNPLQTHRPEGDHGQGHGHGHDRGHDHGHDHGHSHDHDHAHDHARMPPPAEASGSRPRRVEVVQGGSPTQRSAARRALLGSLVLTVVMMVGEILAGVWTGSLLLLSDAAHMAGHAVALAISWVGVRLATVPTGGRNHFGLYRAEVLAAFINGLGVLFTSLWIVVEAVERWTAPVAVRSRELLVVAVLGLVVNLVTAFWLFRAGGRDLNTRSAMVHMATDALSSVAVVLGALWMGAGGSPLIDPALAILIALLVLKWGHDLLRESGAMLLELAPPGLDFHVLRQDLVAGVEGVRDVHDIHVWDITTGYRCATMHVVVGPEVTHRAVREGIAARLRDRFGVGHATLQLEDG